MTTREKILQKLLERAAPLFGKEPQDLTENTAFVADLNAKSVHYSQITTFLEDAFDVEIPYMSFRRKNTLGEAADYVAELLENE